MNVEQHDIVELLAAMESERFEIAGEKIRAKYGHSIVIEKPPQIQDPPEALFHGLDARNHSRIMARGLLRMKRQFVHLSSDFSEVQRFVATQGECHLPNGGAPCSERRCNLSQSERPCMTHRLDQRAISGDRFLWGRRGHSIAGCPMSHLRRPTSIVSSIIIPVQFSSLVQTRPT